jgi:hypothetical protein
MATIRQLEQDHFRQLEQDHFRRVGFLVAFCGSSFIWATLLVLALL